MLDSLVLKNLIPWIYLIQEEGLAENHKDQAEKFVIR